jgi:hypothetical protein
LRDLIGVCEEAVREGIFKAVEARNKICRENRNKNQALDQILKITEDI